MSPAEQNPSAEPTPTVVEEALVPAGVLEDGELVILALKPSGWFVLLVSSPVLLAAVVVFAGVEVFSGLLGPVAWGQGILTGCAAASFLRLVIASLQWMGRLYILTNKRLICIRGVMRVCVAGCLLQRVQRVTLATIVSERALGVGSLLFDVPDGQDVNWLHINRPEEALRIVQEALRRSR